jgi:hypothetical protein
VTGPETIVVAPAAGRWRRIAARTLTVVGVVLAIFAIVANFARNQLLDSGEFRDTAAQLIESDAVRSQVALTLVDQLYQNVDVKAELEAQLPDDFQGLAGPLSAATRQLADRAARELLDRPRVQRLWIETTALAHDELVQVLRGRSGVVTTDEGKVTLDLRELVVRLGEEVGIGGQVADRIPASAAQIALLDSDELGTAQRAVDVLEAVALWLWVLALAVWAAAIWLARGRRRLEVRAIAFGLLVVGIGVLVVRELGGNYLVGELVQTQSVVPAAEAAWSITTRLLADAGWTVILLAVFMLLGVWFAGPGRRASASRRALAPYLRRPELAFGAYAVVVLILLWWGPTYQWRSWLTVLVMIVLGAMGMEAVRRVTATEHPDAVATDVWAGVKARLDAWSASLRDTGTAREVRGSEPREPAPAPAPRTPVELSEQLEAIAALHARGALTDDEFAAAKAKLLA